MHEPGSMIGKYRIEREIGRGGMGAVYLAHDAVIDRRVALKTISKSMLDAQEAQDMLARFKREAQAAGRLTHPNIVAVYDYGEDPDLAYIAMEMVDGRGLQDLMRSGAMPAAGVRPIASQLLAALDFAHGLGVVHRDVKPSNLMLTADGRLKVCDFGIAQLESSRLTQVGTVLGTPSYMSPEQIQGLATDGRSDVFSAGVLLYELLAGCKPFAGDTVAALVNAVLNRAPRAPTAANPALDLAFDAVLLKALAREPGERFANAREFARALEAAFGGRAPHESGYEATVAVATGVSEAPTRALRKIDFTAVRRPQAIGLLEPATERPRILFVDDEERILSALKLLFRLQYEVHVATEGDEALRLLKAHRFHVIVSDQRMPNMNGTELLSRARTVSPDTVRILLTGYSDLAAIVGSVNEGEVYRFASKPWSTTELRDLIAEAAAIGQTLESAPAPVAAHARPEEAILVLDEDREVYLAARDILGRSLRVLHAADLGGALQALRDEKVAVLVADIESQGHSHKTFFKLLKQEHPEIVTIAMTSSSDSEVVIELINQARIFRFLNKPVKLPTLQSHVEAAMAHYQKQKAQPGLLKQQRADVRAQVARPEEASVAGFILGSLRALRRTLAA